MPATSTRRSRSQRRSRLRSAARSKCARSGSCPPTTAPRRPSRSARAADREPRTRSPLVARTHTHAVVDRLFRAEQGRAVATLIRVLGDFDLAEEAVQEAFISALETWPTRGVPDNPGAWITTTARNRAIDRLRRRRVFAEKSELLRRQTAI